MFNLIPDKPEVVKPKRIPRIRKLFRWGFRAFALIISLALLTLITVAVWGYHQTGLKIKEIPALTDPSRAPLPQPVKIYSLDGKLLGQLGEYQRTIVNSQNINSYTKEATIAIEDQRFYQHRGVDFQSLARAAWVDLKARSAVQGASTLTMQYVRNVYLNFQKTANRKFQEVALAWQLESLWSKERVLTAYLNTVYYGNNSYGIEAAARQYFGVTAKELSLGQAAMLAGIIQNPEHYNPRKNLKAAKKRQATVLDEMYAQGYISQREVLRAKRPLELKPLRAEEKVAEPGLFEHAKRELFSKLTPQQRYRGGFRVVTSFNYREIKKARSILQEPYRSLSGERPVIAASFVEARTGRIMVMANSKSRGHFEYAYQGFRQPGSVVKAFTLAEYLSQGGQLSDRVDNSPYRVKDKRRDYTITPTRAGVKTVQEAIKFSQNPAFWRLFQKAGPRKVHRLERQLGMTKMDSNPAAALGGVKFGTTTLELAGALSAFANSGNFNRPHSVIKVQDFLGNLIYTDKPAPRAIIEAEYANQVNLGLSQVVKKGFPELRKNLGVSRRYPLAGKTGTTEDNGDAWFAGYNPEISGAVWTGYAKHRRSLKNIPGVPGGEVFGATIPARSFNKIIEGLLVGRPAAKFVKPKAVQKIPQVVGEKLATAQRLLSQYRFSNVSYQAKFSRFAKRDQVLSIDPPSGIWARPSTAVTVIFQTDQRPAPNFIGKSYLRAISQMSKFARIRPQLIVSDKPLGTVISQDPLPGEIIRAGDTLVLNIATRPSPPKIIVRKEPYVPSDSELAELRAQVTRLEARLGQVQAPAISLKVPDLVGLEITAAQQVLVSLGLKARVIGSGQLVVDQSLSAGSTAEPGTVVILTSS